MVVATDGATVDGHRQRARRRPPPAQRRAGPARPPVGDDHDRRGAHLRPRTCHRGPGPHDDRRAGPAHPRRGRRPAAGIVSIGDIVKHRIDELQRARPARRLHPAVTVPDSPSRLAYRRGMTTEAIEGNDGPAVAPDEPHPGVAARPLPPRPAARRGRHGRRPPRARRRTGARWRSRCCGRTSRTTPTPARGWPARSTCSAGSGTRGWPRCWTPTSTATGPTSSPATSPARRWTTWSASTGRCAATSCCGSVAGWPRRSTPSTRPTSCTATSSPATCCMLDGDPVVIDFGIAHVADDVRLTRTGLVMGTPGYLSPEVVEGAPVTEATDWWGWAATLAFAASGAPPFGRGPMDVVLDRVRRGEADLRGVDPRLAPAAGRRAVARAARAARRRRGRAGAGALRPRAARDRGVPRADPAHPAARAAPARRVGPSGGGRTAAGAPSGRPGRAAPRHRRPGAMGRGVRPRRRRGLRLAGGVAGRSRRTRPADRPADPHRDVAGGAGGARRRRRGLPRDHGRGGPAAVLGGPHRRPVGHLVGAAAVHQGTSTQRRAVRGGRQPVAPGRRRPRDRLQCPAARAGRRLRGLQLGPGHRGRRGGIAPNRTRRRTSPSEGCLPC